MKDLKPNLLFSLDVESIGLYGDAFWVGYCVSDGLDSILERGSWYFDRDLSRGTVQDHYWIATNIKLPFLSEEILVVLSQQELRSSFWNRWRYWKENGAYLLGDCIYPVETNFLADCIRDDPRRAEQAPYPFLDLASILTAKGIDPRQAFERKPEEIKHHPMWDAIQSMRIYWEY